MKHTKSLAIFILLSFILSQRTSGQTLYEIEIRFSGIDADKAKIGAHAYEGYRTIPLKKKAANIISEKTALSAKDPIIEISYFSPKHAPALHRFFLRDQKCTLEVHYDKDADTVKIVKTSGVISFEDAGLNEFKKFAKDELETYEAFGRAYNHDFSGLDSSVLNKIDNYTESVRDKGFQFVKKYPNLLYSTWLFIYDLIGNHRYTMDEQLTIYTQSLKPRYNGSFEEKLILNELDSGRLGLNRKAPLPDKVFKDLKGSSYSISSFGNKLVLVNVWATWCVPCMEEIPKLKELYAKYNPLMEIVSFSTDDDEQKVRNFIKAKDINWINVHDQPEISRAFGSDKGVPQVFLLNDKGIILYSRSAKADYTLDILEKTLAYYAEQQKSNH